MAGYPITRTVWQKNMASIPNDARHVLFENGTLFIRSTQDTVDSGLYVCTKINEVGQSATGNLYLRIMSNYTPVSHDVKYVSCERAAFMITEPPIVTPFQFTKDLQESERAQVSCTIKSGDLPMEFVWRKDNRIVSTDNEIEMQNFKFSSTLLFSNLKPQHAGIYTCIVSNSVASSNYSASLNIKGTFYSIARLHSIQSINYNLFLYFHSVPPKWIVEPEDTAVLDHQPTIMNCQAEGFPEPKVTWTRVSGIVLT